MSGSINEEDDYGAEFDAMVEQTENQIHLKEEQKTSQTSQQKKSFLQNIIQQGIQQQPDLNNLQEKGNLPKEQNQDDQFEQLLQGIFQQTKGMNLDQDQEQNIPSQELFEKMLSQIENQIKTNDSNINQNLPLNEQEQVKEAQKAFENVFKILQTEDLDKNIKQENNQKQENKQNDQAEQQHSENQFGEMFKQFDKILNEEKNKSSQNAQQDDPFAKLFSGILGNDPNQPPTGEDAQMMDMFKGLIGSLNQEAGDGAQKDELFLQFNQFLQETEGDDQMKGILNQVVKDIISKESLYTPMKVLKDEYPEWLEKNWQNLSDEDLERYNKQQDKINDICSLFEKSNIKDNETPSEEIFELLSQLQELGHPPEELMKKIQEIQGLSNSDNLFGQQDKSDAVPNSINDLFK